MKSRTAHYKKLRTITPEEALKNFREKQRRLAEKLGWENDWHKKPIKEDLSRKKRHKSRVKHSGHGE